MGYNNDETESMLLNTHTQVKKGETITLGAKGERSGTPTTGMK